MREKYNHYSHTSKNNEGKYKVSQKSNSEEYHAKLVKKAQHEDSTLLLRWLTQNRLLVGALQHEDPVDLQTQRPGSSS